MLSSQRPANLSILEIQPSEDIAYSPVSLEEPRELSDIEDLLSSLQKYVPSERLINVGKNAATLGGALAFVAIVIDICIILDDFEVFKDKTNLYIAIGVQGVLLLGLIMTVAGICCSANSEYTLGDLEEGTREKLQTHLNKKRAEINEGTGVSAIISKLRFFQGKIQNSSALDTLDTLDTLDKSPEKTNTLSLTPKAK